MSRDFLAKHLEQLRKAGEWREKLMQELAENKQVRRQLERQNVLPTGFLAEKGLHERLG